MRLRHSCLIAAVAGIGFSSIAKATLSVNIERVQISAAAKTADSTLGSATISLARTFDIIVDQEGSEKWSVASAQTTLNTGTMNNANNNGGFYCPTGNGTFSPSASTISTFPNLAYDTAVTTPDGPNGAITTPSSSSAVLGASDYPANQTTPAIMPASPNDTVMDITWGDQQADSSSKGDSSLYASGYASPLTPDQKGYRVARITLIGRAGGTIIGHVSGTQHNFTAENYSFTVPVFGDFNNDGVSNNQDINSFLTALTNPSGYATSFPTANLQWIGDFNDDGVFNNQDINGYLSLLTSGGYTPSGSQVAAMMALVPEPTSLTMLGAGLIGLVARRRRV